MSFLSPTEIQAYCWWSLLLLLCYGAHTPLPLHGTVCVMCGRQWWGMGSECAPRAPCHSKELDATPVCPPLSVDTPPMFHGLSHQQSSTAAK